MDADEALGTLGHRGEPGDRDRRGVGGDDRLRLQVGPQAREDAPLDLLALGGRLDDEIAVGELVRAGAGRDPRERRGALGLVHLALGDLAREQAVDGREPGAQALLGDVAEHDVHPRLGADLGDAVAHLPGADDANLVDHEGHFFIRRRLAPDPAHPMDAAVDRTAVASIAD